MKMPPKTRKTQTFIITPIDNNEVIQEEVIFDEEEIDFAELQSFVKKETDPQTSSSNLYLDESPDVEFDEDTIKLEDDLEVDDLIEEVHSSDDEDELEDCDEEQGIIKKEKSPGRMFSKRVRAYKCKNCFREYCQEQDFRKHMKKCKTPKTLRNCAYCSETFNNLFAHRQHVKKVHPDANQIICEDCGASYVVLEDLENHRKQHTEKVCDKCGKEFQNRRQLMRHKDIHGETSFICSVCGITLKTKKNLNKHMIIHNEAKYKCRHCNKEFKQGGCFKLHLLSHSGLRPYKCHFCPSTFADGSVCRGHMKMVHSDFYREAVESNGAALGPIILFEVPSLRELMQMAEVNEPAKEVKKYAEKKEDIERDVQCPICLAILSTARTLKEHMHNRHSDAEPVKCKYCGEGFKSPTAFKAHLLKHTGIKPFQCQFCTELFFEKRRGIFHMKKHHPADYSALCEKEGGSVECLIVAKTPKLRQLMDGTYPIQSMTVTKLQKSKIKTETVTNENNVDVDSSTNNSSVSVEQRAIVQTISLNPIEYVVTDNIGVNIFRTKTSL